MLGRNKEIALRLQVYSHYRHAQQGIGCYYLREWSRDFPPFRGSATCARRYEQRTAAGLALNQDLY